MKRSHRFTLPPRAPDKVAPKGTATGGASAEVSRTLSRIAREHGCAVVDYGGGNFELQRSGAKLCEGKWTTILDRLEAM